MHWKTLAELMAALGFDRTYAAKLVQRHGVSFKRGPLGYSEAEARLALQKAGIEAAIPAAPAVLTAMETPPVDEELPLPGHCAYDEAVTAGYSLSSALKREKVIEQEIVNDTKREELKTLRGETFTKQQVSDKIQRIAKLVLEVLDTLPELVAEGSTDAHTARLTGRRLCDTLRQRITEKLRLDA